LIILGVYYYTVEGLGIIGFKVIQCVFHLDATAAEGQVDNLESGRDATIATISSLVVVIELKKRDSARLLTSTQWDSFHDKLRGHESPYGKK
jgi:hypothetical protein